MKPLTEPELEQIEAWLNVEAGALAPKRLAEMLKRLLATIHHLQSQAPPPQAQGLNPSDSSTWKPIMPPKNYSGWTCGQCGSPVAGRYCKCEGCGIDPLAKEATPPTATPTPAPPEESQWRCSRCRAILDPQQVTYEEFHDGDCGGKAICEPVTAPQTSAVERAREWLDTHVADQEGREDMVKSLAGLLSQSAGTLRGVDVER